MIQYFINQREPSSFAQGNAPRLEYVCHVDTTHMQVPRAMHMHERVVEFVLMVRGRGSYYIDNRRYEAFKGDMLIFNSHTLHDETVAGKDEAVTYCIAVSDLQLANMPPGRFIREGISPCVRLGRFFPYVRRMFRLIVSGVKKKERSEVLDYLLRALLVKLIHCVREQGEPLSERADAVGWRIKKYIDDKYLEQITLDDMSRDMYLNAYYLSHSFKRIIGYSPMQYVIRRRIGQAQNLLLNTDKTVTEIAMQCGYNNSNYFQAVFRSIVGMPPGQYRKIWLEESRAKK
ncbi:AraC family transcriptional regulator [Anaerovibrio sp.]|uniref:helix-turn-helix transcriptional regulator n=1 Tax=Anaerovibrio sp. TaxID=1872532 RepID=UPI003F13C686